MEYYKNNQACADFCLHAAEYSASATGPPTTITPLSGINTQMLQMPNPGNGTNQVGDNPQEVLFIRHRRRRGRSG